MFRTIGIIISWLPVIISTVTAIEQLLGGGGNGAEKKELALSAIYRVMEKAGLSLSKSLKAIISSTIDVAVAVLNILGVQGFRDSEDQDALELVPASYLDEVEAKEAQTPAVDEARAEMDAKLDALQEKFSAQ